jgi:hypothetical protein
MKTPTALVTAALTAAILLSTLFLIATRGEGAVPSAADFSQPHLWKMKNAPSAISANPSP